jgi:predicted ATPase/class 3 adenylate cyclase
MICPNCQTANDQGSRFCKNCGNPLQSACPRCSTKITADARFCANCGFALVANKPTGTEISGPREHSPDEETNEEIQSSPFTPTSRTPIKPQVEFHPLEGERRVVTILFCDLKGSTALAEHLDPEEWAEIMNATFKHLIEPIKRYDGTVARLMGDAVLAFFGAPKAHEDDPQRAVLAGLDIVAGIQGFNEHLRANHNLEFEVRVGLNTGLAVVGDLKADKSIEYTAMGDAVNLAARMEQTALPGSVQISEKTYRLIHPFFEVEDLGETEIKGKSQAVRAYRVLKPKVHPAAARGLFGRNAPLVGREREMNLLRETLELVRHGRGQIVCLIGEAGIGKSRLIGELQRTWFSTNGFEAGSSEIHRAAGSHTWRESRSISYTTHLPYGTFQQLVRHLCGATPEDSPMEIREKISCECLSDSAPEEQCVRVSRAFEVLLGVETQSDQTRLEGEAFKRELYEAMRITWQDWAERDPTVLVFDDLHWADKASVELLNHLFGLVEDAPLLILCAFRPERESPAWEIKQTAEREYPHRYLEINLKPLELDQSAVLIDHLLVSAELPTTLQEMVLSKAGGNPFFVEQIIQSLIESGVIIPVETNAGEDGDRWKVATPTSQITIPDTVQALLQARIDRLDEGSRQTLQKAAVIGQNFYQRVLREIAIDKAVLNDQLRTLERVDLIQEKARVPEIEFAFRHALAQETVYKNILRRRRRQYHLQVGEAVESLFPERLEEYAPVLAHHFYEAGDGRALHYHTQAADRAFRLHANDEAITHYGRAIELARAQQQFDNLELLYRRKGRALELASQYEQALANYTEMESIAAELGDRHLLLASLLARATVLAIPTFASDPDQARLLLDHALALAQELGDRAAEAQIHWNLALIASWSADARQAIRHGEQAEAIARALDLRGLLARVLNDIGEPYLYVHQFHRGKESILEALNLFRELDDKPMLVDSLSTAGFVFQLAGDYDRAIASTVEAQRIAQAIDNDWARSYSRFYIGLIHRERGEPHKAIAVMQECIHLAEKANFFIPLCYTRMDLAQYYARLGATKYANDMVAEAEEYCSLAPPMLKPFLGVLLIPIHLANGDIEKAEAEYREIRQIATDGDYSFGYEYIARAELAMRKREYPSLLEAGNHLLQMAKEGMITFLQYGHFYQGIAQSKMGNLDEARSSLRQAQVQSENNGTRFLLWEILSSLAEVEQQLGEYDQALRLRRQAVELIHFIADNAAQARPELGTGEELRDAFLNREDVRAVLAATGEPSS